MIRGMHRELIHKYINENQEKQAVHDAYDWEVRSWFMAARLFVPGSSQKGLEKGVSHWDTTVVVGLFASASLCSQIRGGNCPPRGVTAP